MTRRPAPSLRGAVLAALVLTGLLVANPPPDAPPRRSCDEVALVAHRGDTALAVENTRWAVEAAAQQGLSVEVDVRVTRDDGLVLMHDATVGRTTDGGGPVAALTTAEIRGLRTEDGQQVALVEEALAVVAAHPRSRLVLDLKDSSRRASARLGEQLRRHGLTDRVVAISFRRQLLDDLRRHVTVPTFHILRSGEPLPEPEEAAPHGLQSAAHDVDDRAVARYEEAGVRWNARKGADDTTTWQAALHSGTRFVITSQRERFRDFCQERRQRPFVD